MKVFDTSGIDGFRTDLTSRAESREEGVLTSWQTATYRAAEASEWFCNRGIARSRARRLYKVPVSRLPQSSDFGFTPPMVEQNPQSAQARSLAGEMHLGAGAHKEALAAFKQAYEIERSKGNLDRLADCYLITADKSLVGKDYTAAITILEEGLKTCGQVPLMYRLRSIARHNLLADYLRSMPKPRTESERQTLARTGCAMAQLALDDLRTFQRLSPGESQQESILAEIADLEGTIRVCQPSR